MSEQKQATPLHEAPEEIFLQVDLEGDGPGEWDTLDGATWCQDRINEDDVRYVRADLVEQLEANLVEAVSAVQRLSEGQPFDAIVIADTVKRRTAQLEAELDKLKSAIELYEQAFKASWPSGAKGDAFNYWNAARIIIAKGEKK